MKLHTSARMTMVLALASLALPVTALADTIIYDDGSINGSLSSIFINLAFATADSFTLSSSATLSGVKLGLWTPGTDNSPLTLDWSIWNAPGPGGVGGVILDSATDASLTNSFLFENSFDGGYGVYQSSFSLPSISLGAGTYWLELQNAVNTVGNSVSWDLNNGPADVWVNTSGFITAPDCGDLEGTPGLTSCASAFQILGGTPNTVPEPRGLAAIFGAGALCLAAALRRSSNGLRMTDSSLNWSKLSCRTGLTRR
jgi:hypothetical protein